MNIAPADDQLFKRGVEKPGIECTIMQSGDEVEVYCLTRIQPDQTKLALKGRFWPYSEVMLKILYVCFHDVLSYSSQE